MAVSASANASIRVEGGTNLSLWSALMVKKTMNNNLRESRRVQIITVYQNFAHEQWMSATNDTPSYFDSLRTKGVPRTTNSEVQKPIRWMGDLINIMPARSK
jgi:hypothetical protein